MCPHTARVWTDAIKVECDGNAAARQTQVRQDEAVDTKNRTLTPRMSKNEPHTEDTRGTASTRHAMDAKHKTEALAQTHTPHHAEDMSQTRQSCPAPPAWHTHETSTDNNDTADSTASCQQSSNTSDEYDDTQWETLTNTNVTFEDILGCTRAVEIIKEAVVIPMRFPTLFKKLKAKRSNGMILYGPPGTGKTMIARATASEVEACFFNASCAELTSRWVGGSEKKLKSLFKAALHKAPSVIFFDEIDSIASNREGDTSIADQRLTNQLLIELDNIYTSQAQVFVIAATNLPWKIDLAVMRRFPASVYIPLPDYTCRRAMFSALLHDSVGAYNDAEYDKLADMALNMSGSDIANIINSIRFQPLRLLYQCNAFTYSRDGPNGVEISVSMPLSLHVQHPCDIQSCHEIQCPVLAECAPALAECAPALAEYAARERGGVSETTCTATCDTEGGADMHNMHTNAALAQHANTDMPSCNTPPILYMDLMQIIESYGEDCIVIPRVDFVSIEKAVALAQPTATPEYIQKYETYHSSRNA